jgi:hypothetical protein
MIIIFEPQCRGFAHEQFNAGFLYGYLLAYPQERIVFWGEKEHIKCLQAVFSSANVAFDQVEFVEVEIPEPNQLSRISVIFEYSRLFEELFLYASRNNCNKIVLLSIYSYNLLPLKYLSKWRYKNFFQFHIMMHGTLEFVKRNNFSIPFANYFLKLFKLIGRLFKLPNVKFELKPTNKYLYEKLFKTSLRFLGNENIAYFVFREDSLKSVGKYLPEIHPYFKSIDLPYIFKDAPEEHNVASSSKKVFATIGQGDLLAIQKIVRKLNSGANMNVNNYEIRIVGPRKMGQEYLEPIKYIGNGQVLLRAEIEEQIKDVQYVLFFYGPDSYELTTSGSFFDAIAYCKPMIFLSNRCFDYYYENYKFGFRCKNLDEMVAVMQKITLGIDRGYPEYSAEIRRMRADISISRNYCKLKFI